MSGRTLSSREKSAERFFAKRNGASEEGRYASTINSFSLLRNILACVGRRRQACFCCDHTPPDCAMTDDADVAARLAASEAKCQALGQLIEHLVEESASLQRLSLIHI